MLIRPVGDIHLEFWNANKINRTLDRIIPKLDTDKDTVLTIAGDMGLCHKYHTWAKPLEYLSDRFKHIVYVEGNHFFYGNNIFGNIKDAKKVISDLDNVYFLENDYKIIDDIVFIGATFWTNFNNRDPIAMWDAAKGMNDYYQCKKFDNTVLTVEDTANAHDISQQFIFDTIKHFRDKKCVIVTHHAPAKESVHKQYKGNNLNYAYYSDYGDRIELYDNIIIWQHGHTHTNFDYILNKTRIVCNPFGYLSIGENKNFQSNLLIEA